MSTLNSALEDLWQVADGNPGPRSVDSVNSIENHCRECLDDELLGATAQLFGAGELSVPAIMRHSFEGGIDPKSPEHAEVVKLREELLRFIEWLLCEEYAEARQLPEEQIAEYATEIVSLCIAVFRKEGESSKVRELSCEGAPRRPRPHLPSTPPCPSSPLAPHPLDTPLPARRRAQHSSRRSTSGRSRPTAMRCATRSSRRSTSAT